MVLKTLLTNDIIEAIKLSFDESILGAGFSLMCDVEITPKDANNSNIVFTPKDPEKVPTFGEILEFGMLIGRDFLVDPEYIEWKETRHDALKRDNDGYNKQKIKRTDIR